MERFTYVLPAVPYFYRYGRLDTDERCGWLHSVLKEHKLFIPLAAELNDLREARPPLERRTAEEIRIVRRVPLGPNKRRKPAPRDSHLL